MLFEQRTHHSWSFTIGPPPSPAGIAPYDLRALSLDHFEHLKEFAWFEVGHVGRAGWAGRLWGGRPALQRITRGTSNHSFTSPCPCGAAGLVKKRVVSGCARTPLFSTTLHCKYAAAASSTMESRLSSQRIKLMGLPHRLVRRLLLPFHRRSVDNANARSNSNRC